MHKLVTEIVLLLLAIASCGRAVAARHVNAADTEHSVFGLRRMLQDNTDDNSGSATSSTVVLLEVTNGTGTAGSSALAQGVAETENSVSNTVAEAFLEVSNGEDSEVQADIAAEAIAKAVASALSKAEGFVDIKGEGKGQAISSTAVRVVARATAQAIGRAVAGATNGNKRAIAEVKVSALSRQLVRAISDASIEVSAENGAAAAVQESVASATVEPVAQALGRALILIQQGVVTTGATGEAATGTEDGSDTASAGGSSVATGGQTATQGSASSSMDESLPGESTVETATSSQNGYQTTSANGDAQCSAPCYHAELRGNFQTCKPQCNKAICDRGYQVYSSMAECCKKGAAFNKGCNEPPTACYVVESRAARTCKKDNTKCLRGYGVWTSLESCCQPGAAFKQGCAKIQPANQPCWVAGSYWPAKQCAQSTTACSQSWGVFGSEKDCCARGGAFKNGCDNPPPVPCWIVDTYHPLQLCRKTSSVPVCNRGWGVFVSRESCCKPGAVFSKGCST